VRGWLQASSTSKKCTAYTESLPCIRVRCQQMKKRAVPTTEFAGQGDPEATLNLLWGVTPQVKRGPKPSLSARLVGHAALAIVGIGGLQALSMRALGERLGVAAMAVYRYVPDKEALLELLLEAAYAELPDGLPAGQHWQHRLTRVATDAWELYVAHPWMLQVSLQRPSLGPHAIRKYERELSAVAGIGLTDLEMDLTVAAVSDLVRGCARSANEAHGAAAQTGQTDAQWWAAHTAHLARLLDPSLFPLAVRVGSAAGASYGGPTDPGRTFEFGLGRLICGIEVLIEARSIEAHQSD
jgi:AcrR family transcriptional regulator